MSSITETLNRTILNFLELQRRLDEAVSEIYGGREKEVPEKKGEYFGERIGEEEFYRDN